jgi:hypothetical protein
MTLLVRDEEDILRENIEYHKSQGVDYFIVTDNASVDGTTKILKEYEEDGILTYIRENGNYNQSKWVTSMARIAYKKFNADWVINNDADEFWWPNNGDLKSTLERIPKRYTVVRAKRHNFLLSSRKTSEPFYKRMVYRRKISLNPIGKPLPPKVCQRGLPNIEVGAGSHGIKKPVGLEIIDGDMEIFHYPIRNYNQLRNKVINIGSGYEINPNVDKSTGVGPGSAQRAVYAEYKRDPASLKLYYKNQMHNFTRICIGLVSGKIIKDKRLSEYLIYADDDK